MKKLNIVDVLLFFKITMEKLLNNSEKINYIFGVAGTGKSFLIRRGLEEHANAVALTFTNTSAMLLSNDVNSLRVRTIHSALGIFWTFDEEYEEVSVISGVCCSKHILKEPSGMVRLCDYVGCSKRTALDREWLKDKIVFVDECSLVPHYLFNLLTEIDCLKLIFVGDPYQISPVDDEKCLVCSGNCKFNLFIDAPSENTITLSENYRNSSSILEIINGYKTKNSLCLETFDLKKEVREKNLPSSPILCYRNVMVDFINGIFTRDQLLPQPGNPIAFLAGASSVPAGHVFRVLECIKDTVCDPHLGDIPVLIFIFENRNPVYSAIYPGELKSHFISLLRKFDNEKSILDKENIRKRLIYRYRSFINPWVYAFAQTVHKAQGATFDTAYLFLSDLCRAPASIRRRLIYTALSRARSNIFTVLVPSRWTLGSFEHSLPIKPRITKSRKAVAV